MTAAHAADLRYQEDAVGARRMGDAVVGEGGRTAGVKRARDLCAALRAGQAETSHASAMSSRIWDLPCVVSMGHASMSIPLDLQAVRIGNRLLLLALRSTQCEKRKNFQKKKEKRKQKE